MSRKGDILPSRSDYSHQFYSATGAQRKTSFYCFLSSATSHHTFRTAGLSPSSLQCLCVHMPIRDLQIQMPTNTFQFQNQLCPKAKGETEDAVSFGGQSPKEFDPEEFWGTF